MSASIKAARASVVGRSSPGLPQGDPGLFGGLFGALKGGLKGLSGGPLGVITGSAEGFRAGFGRPRVPTPIQTPTGPVLPPIPAPIQIAKRSLVANGANGRSTSVPVTSTPGLLSIIQQAIPGGATGMQVAGAAVQPRGFHANKSDYFLKDGTFVPKGSVWVKNRRRNPLNARALRNAIGRVDAGKVWQSKLHEISTGKFTAAGTRKSCA